MGLPPDLKFGAAIAILGIVMLSISPQAAFWLGAVLVLAAMTYSEHSGKQQGHSFTGDLMALISPENTK